LKLVYIAGPYRSASQFVPGEQDAFGVLQNVMRAMATSLEVWRAGAVGVCPHGNTFCFQGAANDSVWLDGDIELMKRCDAVLMTPDWDRSSGARKERDIAIEEGIPVCYDIEELKGVLEL
jgi:hypothetical protein